MGEKRAHGPPALPTPSCSCSHCLVQPLKLPAQAREKVPASGVLLCVPCAPGGRPKAGGEQARPVGEAARNPETSRGVNPALPWGRRELFYVGCLHAQQRPPVGKHMHTWGAPGRKRGWLFPPGSEESGKGLERRQAPGFAVTRDPAQWLSSLGSELAEASHTRPRACASTATCCPVATPPGVRSHLPQLLQPPVQLRVQRHFANADTLRRRKKYCCKYRQYPARWLRSVRPTSQPREAGERQG